LRLLEEQALAEELAKCLAWDYGLELSLVAAATIALLLARRWPENSIKPDRIPGRA